MLSALRVTVSSSVLPSRRRLSVVAPIALAFFALWLQGCSQTAPQPDAVTSNSAAPEAIPELTLNLPKHDQCICEVASNSDYTFLEKGFAAVAADDYLEAVQYFQRYQRLESSPVADWEAAVALAFVSSLSGSPTYDPKATRKSYRQLRKVNWQQMQLHQQVHIMRQSLESFILIERELSDLKETSATLKEDLAKREEALKRLRELTLGQRGTAP